MACRPGSGPAALGLRAAADVCGRRFVSGGARARFGGSGPDRGTRALVDRLSVGGTADARYRLEVRLDDSIQGLGVLNDDAISRERRTLRARYQLVDAGTGEILLDATAGSDAGIDVVSSEYATIAAEQTALENLARDVADRIVLSLSQQFQASQ